MATASDFKVKKGLQVQGGDVNLGGGDTAGVIQVDVADSGVGLDLTISAGESASGAGGSLKLRTAATTSLADRLVISPTATTISDGTYDFTVASHDGSNGLILGSTLVTTTAAELNIMDGGTSSSAVTVVDADRLVLNDGGTMKQVSMDQFETYFESALDTLSNVTSLGTLTALTVDDVAINGKVITMTGDTSDTVTMTAAGGGAFTVATTDAGGATGHINLDADGNITLDADAGTITFADGGSSLGTITSSGFTGDVVGAVTGDVTGNVSGSAATVTAAAQTAITSLGTLTALTVDDVAINGKIITMTGDTSDTVVMTAGAAGTFSLVTTDAGGTGGNIQITADGTAELAGTAVTLDSVGGITLDADSGTITFADDGVSMGTITSSGYSGYAKADKVRTVLTQTTDDSFYPTFAEASASGDQYIRTDDNFLYNPNTSHLTVDLLSGTLQTAAQANITSLGTLTALTGGTGDLVWDSNTLFVDSSENGVGIGPSSQINAGTALTVMGAVSLKDAANPSATDVAGYGQLWVKDVATNNQLYFTTDAGTDIQLTSGTAIASGGAASSLAADDLSTGDAAVTLDSSSGSAITVNATAAQLQLKTTTSGQLDITAVADLDINVGTTSTLDAVTSHTLTTPTSVVDASSSHTINTPVLTITDDTGGTRPVFTVQQNVNAQNGPTFQLENNKGGSTAGAENDIVGTMTFIGVNDGPATHEYGKMYTKVNDPGDGDETATMHIQLATGNDGTLKDVITIAGGTTTAAASTTTIAGNLNVSGTTTTVDSTVVSIADPIFELGSSASDDDLDRGIKMKWHNGSAAKTAFMGYDDSTGKFLMIADATDSSNVFSGTASTLVANLDGTVNTASQGSITTAANLTTVGALDAGSITSNFTSIDVGAGAISTTGTVTAGPIVSTGLSMDSTVLMDYYKSGSLTSTGAVTMFDITSATYSAFKVIVSVYKAASPYDRSIAEYLITTRGDDGPTTDSDDLFMTEYAIVETGGAALATVTAVKDSTSTKIKVAPASSTSTYVRAQITQFVI